MRPAPHGTLSSTSPYLVPPHTHTLRTPQPNHHAHSVYAATPTADCDIPSIDDEVAVKVLSPRIEMRTIAVHM